MTGPLAVGFRGWRAQFSIDCCQNEREARQGSLRFQTVERDRKGTATLDAVLEGVLANDLLLDTPGCAFRFAVRWQIWRHDRVLCVHALSRRRPVWLDHEGLPTMSRSFLSITERLVQLLGHPLLPLPTKSFGHGLKLAAATGWFESPA